MIPLQGPTRRLERNLAQAVWASRSGLLILLLTAGISLPLCFAIYPPLYDYPFHLARRLILRDIWSLGPLSRYYEINSLIVPNVAMDVIGTALQKFLAVEQAGRAFLILAIFLTISGVAFLSYTLFGRVGFAPWLGALLTYNWVFTIGFINYLFALGLLPWGVAFFVRLRPSSLSLRLFGGLLICLTLFFSHLVVFVLYGLIIASLEAQWGVPLLRGRRMEVIGRSVVSGLPVVATFALFLIESPTVRAAGEAISYDGFRSVLGFIRYKSLWPMRALSSGSELANWVSAGAATAVAALIARFGYVRINRELLVAILLIGLVYWLAPGHLFSAQFVDMRIPLAAYLILAGTINIYVGSVRGRWAITAVLIALLTFRSATMAFDWSAIEPAERQITAAFHCLAPRSILFAAETDPSLVPSGSPSLGHMFSVAEITNGAFVPATWAHPAQQPIRVKPEYADIYALQTPNARLIGDEKGLQAFSAEIQDLMAGRRATGQDDFGGNVYLLYMFPERLGYPRIAGATVVAEQWLFTLYRLPVGMSDGRDALAGNSPVCNAN